MLLYIKRAVGLEVKISRLVDLCAAATADTER
jgi:hypothetical protein